MASTSQQTLPRHDTFQSDDNFTVSFYVRDLAPADVSVSFRERSLKLILPEATHDVGPLAHAIDPESSTFRVSKVKVELVLRKRETGLKWNRLIGEEEASPMAAARPSESTSASSGPRPKKDWSKITEDELSKADPEPEGDAAVNDLFKKIYAGADPDAQRAMLKSYQESGGTTLSTNWAEIGQKKTEVKPPDGMEAKKWE